MTKEEIIEIAQKYEAALDFLAARFSIYRSHRSELRQFDIRAVAEPLATDGEVRLSGWNDNHEWMYIDALLRTPEEMKADYEKELADKAEAEKQRLVDYETKRVTQRRKLYEELRAEFEGSEE